MKRLSLSLDDLQVDSFLTTSPVSARGTVYGQETGYGGETCITCIWTCEGQQTCAWDCNPADTDLSCAVLGCPGTGYTACEACTSYGNPGGGDACMQTVESDCRTQTVC